MAFLNDRVKMSKSEKNLNNSESNLEENYVRVLLFKESGVKGRTLIFDSAVMDSLFTEIPDVQMTSHANFQKITEMVFGSLSLRCRETNFRIHNLSSPNRIMFTQVFPSPGSKKIRYALDSHISPTIRNICYLGEATYDATSRNSSQSFDLGITGLQLDQQLSNCQPNAPNFSTSTIDSGYVEQSYSSFVISSRNSFNSDASLNRKQIELSKTETRTFLTESSTELDIYSNQDYTTKPSPMIGLVIILAVTNGDKYPDCYVKYIAFIESVVFRIRQNIEFAFNKPGTLLSTMIQIFHESTQWLIRIFPDLRKCNTCEVDNIKCDKLNRYREEIHDDPSKLKVVSSVFKIKRQKFSLLRNKIFSRKNTSQHKSTALICSKSEDYFEEFCKILEILENKETNFFLSTLITATLTYHLGWINTCFSESFFGKEYTLQTDTNSYNSLWRQITELYGAHGYPIKSAQTIINGTSDDIISKILHFIRYFVRYSTVTHNCIERINVDNDNKNADMICLNSRFCGNDATQSSAYFSPTQLKLALHKSKACSSNLSQLSENDCYGENYLSQEKKVTFLLGENEELVNIKPNVKNPNLESSKETNSISRHSNSGSVFDNLCDLPKQQHLEMVNLFHDKHSRSKSPDIKKEKELDLEINYQMAYSDFGDKNKQVLCTNRKHRNFHKATKMKILSFPLPKWKLNKTYETSSTSTLESDVVGKYVPDMVMQGTNIPQEDWMLRLNRDLHLTRQIYFFNGYVDESVAIVGNVDKWDVEIISSRVKINRNTIGFRLDISSLVANILEVLLQMWNLNFCKKYCTTHIEQRLLEICIRSYAFSQLLLHTDMCTMDLLTATLHFEINDVPLLMSVASVIAPEVTKKYGLSLQ